MATKTIVGLFDNFSDAEAVARDLVENGFRHDDISLVMNNADGKYSRYANIDDEIDVVTGAATGAAIGGLTGLLVGLGALMIPGIGPVIAAGPLATTIAGLTVGAATGAWAGALSEEANVPEDAAMLYAEAIRRGAILVTVRTESESKATRAAAIMNRHHPVDPHQRAAQWRQEDQTEKADKTAPSGVPVTQH